MRLTIFAFHVTVIMSAEGGAEFTLCYGDNGEEAVIHVKSDSDVSVNDEYAGNKQGAVQYYANLVNKLYKMEERKDG